MYRLIYIILLYVFQLGITNGQVMFENYYEVNVNNKFNHVIHFMPAEDNGYYFATTAFHEGNNFLMMGKFDSDGEIVWVKQIDENYTIRQANVDQDADDNLFLAYSALNGNPPRFHSVLVKTDVTGNPIWSRSYGDTSRTEYCENVFVTENAIFLAGETSSPDFKDLYLHKTDLNGNLIWSKRYHAGGTDYLRDSKLLSNGDILLSGTTFMGSGNRSASIFRINQDGDILWGKQFRIPTNKRFNPQAIGEGYDGSLLISGHVDTVSTEVHFGLWDMFLMKLSSDGDFKWARIYGGEHWDETWSVKPCPDGGYILGAEPESFGFVSRMGLLKTDSLGNMEWMKLYGSADGSFPNNVLVNDDGYIIFGTDGSYNQNAPMLLVRTDFDGNSICTSEEVTLPQDSFIPQIEDVGSVVSMAGEADFTPVLFDYPLMAREYCDPIIVSEVPNSNIQVYPNPFVNQLFIRGSSHGVNSINIQIFNASGENVYDQIHNGTADSYFYHLDLSNLSSGLYFVQINVNDSRHSVKVVKI